MKKHPKTVTITQGDLSRALKEPKFNVERCLVAQTALRNRIMSCRIPDPYIITCQSPMARRAMDLFDRVKRDGESDLLPELKAMLPIKVKLNE